MLSVIACQRDNTTSSSGDERAITAVISVSVDEETNRERLATTNPVAQANTPTPTNTAVPTDTPVPILSPTNTNTPTPEVTPTPTPTPTTTSTPPPTPVPSERMVLGHRAFDNGVYAEAQAIFEALIQDTGADPDERRQALY